MGRSGHLGVFVGNAQPAVSRGESSDAEGLGETSGGRADQACRPWSLRESPCSIATAGRAERPRVVPASVGFQLPEPGIGTLGGRLDLANPLQADLDDDW